MIASNARASLMVAARRCKYCQIPRQKRPPGTRDVVRGTLATTALLPSLRTNGNERKRQLDADVRENVGVPAAFTGAKHLEHANADVTENVSIPAAVAGANQLEHTNADARHIVSKPAAVAEMKESNMAVDKSIDVESGSRQRNGGFQCQSLFDGCVSVRAARKSL